MDVEPKENKITPETMLERTLFLNKKEIVFLLIGILILAGLVVNCDSPNNNHYSTTPSQSSVTKSELKVVNETPVILINGEDKITFVNQLYYFSRYGMYDPLSGALRDDYGGGVWLAIVKKQIDEMNKNGANTLVLNIYWSDLVTATSRPSDVEGSINFTPLDEAMAYAKEKNIYVMIYPKIDVFLPSWWKKENNFPETTDPNTLAEHNVCVPQEKNADHACIPKEICTIGDSRCCSVPKEQLYCCTLDIPTSTSKNIVTGVSVGLTADGMAKCKEWNNNPIYSTCTECETDSYGWKYGNPGMSAGTFRKDYSRYLTALVKHYKDNPAVIGWVFSLGPSGEGQYGPSYIALRQIYGNNMVQASRGQLADYSDDAQQKFKVWMKNKYGSDEKLQTAWGDPTLSLETIKLPNPKILFKESKEGPFPDNTTTGFLTSLDNLTQCGRDFYDFREYVRDYQITYFTNLIKSIDRNHVLTYIGNNNDGFYNNSNIDALMANNHVEYAYNKDNGDIEEINYIAIIAALNKKHRKASIFALESAGENGGLEGKSSDKEKQKETLLKAFKVIKCMGSYMGYVSSFDKDLPSGLSHLDIDLPFWLSSDLKVLNEIGSYTPGVNCICDLIKPDGSVAVQSVSDLVKLFGLEECYSCQ